VHTAIQQKDLMSIIINKKMRQPMGHFPNKFIEKGSVDNDYFDKLDNRSLNKYKKILKIEKHL
jgi:hypothetical protein